MLKYKVILRYSGLLLFLEGIAMLLAMVAASVYKEPVSGPIFIASAITIGVGILILTFIPSPKKKPEKKDIILLVPLTWILLSLFGAMPYLLSGVVNSFTDAWFESVSGFTTTGSTIFNHIDGLPHGILFWRSLTQWIGGIAILFLAFIAFPILRIGGMQIFILDSPGITSERLRPQIQSSVLWLLGIYSGLTLLETILLSLEGMPFFDAICHSFSTLSTGGFSTHQQGISYFHSPLIEYTLIVFMILSGINYALLYLVSQGKIRKAIKNEELRCYAWVIVVFTGLITWGLLMTTPQGYEEAFRNGLFHVVAILTTTGFYTTDYLSWYPTLWYLLFFLFFVGASVGSTSGSIKLIRIELLLKNTLLEVKRLLNPNAIIPVRFNKRLVPDRIKNNIVAFTLTYILIFIIGIILFSLIDPNLPSALGAVAGALGNIGPGLGHFGPGNSYATVAPAGKLLLSFLMLLGRLEIFTLLVLFTRSFWKH